MARRGPPLLRVIGSGLRSDLAGQIPDEPGEFSSDGGADLVLMQTACTQSSVGLAEAQLCPPGDLAHGSRLVFIANLRLAGDLCREAICPSRLDPNATGVRVSGHDV
jgi:hypothetical protein